MELFRSPGTHRQASRRVSSLRTGVLESRGGHGAGREANQRSSARRAISQSLWPNNSVSNSRSTEGHSVHPRRGARVLCGAETSEGETILETERRLGCRRRAPVGSGELMVHSNLCQAAGDQRRLPLQHHDSAASSGLQLIGRVLLCSAARNHRQARLYHASASATITEALAGSCWRPRPARPVKK